MHIKRAFVVFVLIASYSTPIFSCSTPVFRYALEMWGAYAYVVEVIHDGNLNSSERQALENLKIGAASESSVNIKVIEVLENHPKDIKKEDLPIIRLSFPKEHEISQIIWQGKLTEENVMHISDSPSRKQVLNNIENGDAAVWLFLASGNAERDAKQLKILKEELLRLSKSLKLSETATDVSGKLLDIKVINTGVTFSLVQIDRNDPAEEIFIQILLGTEADLQLFNNVPLAFPIFGQGRALYALAGNGIKAKNIETACSTIIGWCSCTIKDDNPGTDLLIRADWEKIIGDSSWIIREEIPDITGLSNFISDEAEVEEDPVVISAISKPIEEKTEKEVEEKLVVEVVDVSKIASNISKENSESTSENEDVLISTVSDNTNERLMNPLLRNSLFAFVLLLVVVATTSFILKRK